MESAFVAANGGMGAASGMMFAGNGRGGMGNMHGMSMNPNSILESIKPMLISMLMMNTMTGKSSSENQFANLIAMIWSFIALSLVDYIVTAIPFAMKKGIQYIDACFHLTPSSADVSDALTALQDTAEDTTKKDDAEEDGKVLENKKTASILVFIENASQQNLASMASSSSTNTTAARNFNISNALMDLLTNHPATRSIVISGSLCKMNDPQPIQFNKNVYVQYKMAKSAETALERALQNEPSGGHGGGGAGAGGAGGGNASDSGSIIKSVPHGGSAGSGAISDVRGRECVEVFSTEMDMTELRAYLDSVVADYTTRINNRLGNQIYYFNEIMQQVPRLQTGQLDYTKAVPCMSFTMKPFHTNRSFRNLFGEEISKIRKRVEFFRDNEKWYNDKGIPYTLGILMSGQSGAGKTSTIKCLSNELKRHVVNVSLTEFTTKRQMENLFFSPMLCVVNEGKTEWMNIPIDKRIYVFEDVDCQNNSDLVMERTLVNMIAEREREVEMALLEASQGAGGSLGMSVTGPRMNMSRHNGNGMGEMGVDANRMLRRIPPNSCANSNSASNPISANSLSPMDQNTILTEKKAKNDANSEKLSLSFLLNILDGILETPGRIIIMTANWVEKMDHALIRPGRFDITAKFGKCAPKMMVDMFQHYYDNKLTDAQMERIMNLKDGFISPAELSKVLFEFFGQDLDNAILNLETLYLENQKREAAIAAANAAADASFQRAQVPVETDVANGVGMDGVKNVNMNEKAASETGGEGDDNDTEIVTQTTEGVAEGTGAGSGSDKPAVAGRTGWIGNKW